MAKEATRESVIDRLVKNTRQKYGKITEGAGTDLSKRFYSGLRLPHLCMQYLVCANIFPLNSIVQLRGPRDTLKSALAIQIGRWFIDNGGDFVYGDAENKAPMDIVDSILETPNAREDHPRFHHFPVHSAPEAQQLIQLNIAASKEANVEIAAHNESHPDDYWEPLCVMVLLDSFVAGLSEEDKAKIAREGSSDRIAPYGKIWSRTIAKLKSDLVDSNATLVIINHERPSPGNIYAGIQVPGPTALGYLEALDIRT